VRDLRKEWDLRPVYKMVDTCAAEFDAVTPYFYSTYEEENEALPLQDNKVLVANFPIKDFANGKGWIRRYQLGADLSKNERLPFPDGLWDGIAIAADGTSASARSASEAARLRRIVPRAFKPARAAGVSTCVMPAIPAAIESTLLLNVPACVSAPGSRGSKRRMMASGFVGSPPALRVGVRLT